jgi:predicted nucleotide-binding protein (sugar kinase/HSP70/actin superfamily)
MGYEFEIFSVSIFNIISTFKKLSGKSIPVILKAIKDLVKKISDIDEKKRSWSEGKFNIGIIGEIYTCCEEKINYSIEQKLKKLDVNPYNTCYLSNFIKDSLKILCFQNYLKRRKYKKMAMKYLHGRLGGHGVANIINLIRMKERGVDGIIHILPLSCMPETTVEPIINLICQENEIPLIQLPIDETNSEANVDTRIETFIELIKRKKINTTISK